MSSMLRRANAMKGPDWRWQLAQKLAAKESIQDDVISILETRRHKKSQALQDAVSYHRAQAAGQAYEQLAAEHPLIVAAFDLHLAPAASEAPRLYTLAGASRARIAKACRLKIEVVRCWERLFFDARPLRMMPTALAAVTVAREIAAGRTELAAKMKLAIGGGLLAVEAMQRLAAGTLLSEADAVYQRELQLELRAKQALCIPLRSESALVKFQAAYMQYDAERARIALARERLRTLSEMAMARLEIQRLRAAQASPEPSPLKVVGDEVVPAEGPAANRGTPKADAA